MTRYLLALGEINHQSAGKEYVHAVDFWYEINNHGATVTPVAST